MPPSLSRPHPRKPRQNGRPCLQGKRLPTLAQVLTSAATRWTTVTVRGWYGARARVVHLRLGHRHVVSRGNAPTAGRLGPCP